MKRKLTLILASMFLCVGIALAQTPVKGVVVSAEDNEPVIGATVKVAGSQTGTVTDMNGEFSLNVAPGARLEVSYVGMITKAVKASQNMKVALESDAQALDEVMVVAYGTQKKSSFTGAASTVKGDKLEKLQVSDVSKALEGAVAGVQIASTSGTPGSSATIHVRGIGSVLNNSQPLIVLDGVPYEGSLNSIPTQDIESLTILKDAAANSMYGARGANGVIMVTTKGGKTGKPVINFDARIGVNTRGVPTYDIITDAGEYYEMAYESYRNSLVAQMGWAGASEYAAKNLISGMLKYNKFAGVADTELINPLTGKLNPNATTYKWGDDWTKDPFENGLRQEYTIGINGGTDNTKAYVSFGYLNDEGYVAGSGFDRFNTRLKLDQNIGKYIRVGANMAYARTSQKTFGREETNFSNIFMFSQMIAPIYPIYLYDNDGKPMLDDNGGMRYDFGEEYGRPYAGSNNPVATSLANLNEILRDNLTARGYFEASFLKDFKFTTNLAYDLFNTNETIFYTPIGGDAGNVNGRGYKQATRYEAVNWNQLLDWNRDFGKHNVHILLGHETKNDKERLLFGHMTNFVADIPDFSQATQYQDLTSNTTEYSLEGYFAKGEYNYADKYYFTASIRRDGSSRFYKDNRWGTFWAVGASWRLKEESWLKDVDYINNLKFKISYGTQGNDNIQIGTTAYSTAYTDLYSVDRVDGSAAFTKVFRGNKDLTWEKSQNFNVGFEAGLWSRLNVNFDFFVKKTLDMLYQSPIPTSEGAPAWILRNEMDMKNTGIELEINGDIIKTKDIRWNAALNLTHYKNELTRLPDSKPASEYPDGYQAGSYWRKLGGSLYDFYTYEYVGVDAETGLPQYNKYTKDENGVEHVTLVNKSTDATYRQTGKSAIPDVMGGLTTTVEGYGFDLSIATAFQLGGYVVDDFYSSLMNSGAQGGYNYHKDLFNRWTPSNTNTNIPKLFASSQDAGISGYSDFFLTSASYFSLRNVTLGYTVPTKVTNKWGISRLRVYFAGDNLWMQSKRKGLDPRQSFKGTTGYVYSALSTYSFGLNLTF